MKNINNTNFCQTEGSLFLSATGYARPPAALFVTLQQLHSYLFLLSLFPTLEVELVLFQSSYQSGIFFDLVTANPLRLKLLLKLFSL